MDKRYVGKLREGQVWLSRQDIRSRPPKTTGIEGRRSFEIVKILTLGSATKDLVLAYETPDGAAKTMPPPMTMMRSLRRDEVQDDCLLVHDPSWDEQPNEKEET